MTAYRRVYDSRHLQADCQEPGSAPEPTLGNRVWALPFTFLLRRAFLHDQSVLKHFCSTATRLQQHRRESRLRCHLPAFTNRPFGRRRKTRKRLVIAEKRDKCDRTA